MTQHPQSRLADRFSIDPTGACVLKRRIGAKVAIETLGFHPLVNTGGRLRVRKHPVNST